MSAGLIEARVVVEESVQFTRHLIYAPLPSYDVLGQHSAGIRLGIVLAETLRVPSSAVFQSTTEWELSFARFIELACSFLWGATGFLPSCAFDTFVGDPQIQRCDILVSLKSGRYTLPTYLPYLPAVDVQIRNSAGEFVDQDDLPFAVATSNLRARLIPKQANQIVVFLEQDITLDYTPHDSTNRFAVVQQTAPRYLQPFLDYLAWCYDHRAQTPPENLLAPFRL